jgi:tRNA-specific 2-thiouridylase
MARVVVAMSGGVDSSVAAALLKEAGHEVIGITMQLWDHSKAAPSSASKKEATEGEAPRRFDSCCSLSDVNDARMVAHALGIPHYVVNYEREFRTGVVDYFASEYAKGRTPNPCVMCNSQLKFDHLVDRAEALGATWVATGHYARVVHRDDGPSELFTGLDSGKDQSYFLFDVRPSYLRRALFPLGGMTKSEVRAAAERFGLHTAQKHESQEICFVSGKRYTDFLETHYEADFSDKSGEIVDPEGNVLGRHGGIHHYTVGQRKGIGGLIPGSAPKYVTAIDAKTGRVVVDDLDKLAVAGFTVERVNWQVPVGSVAEAGRALTVMVRYRAKPVPCRVVELGDGAWQVVLAAPARWVTPGQAAVFYDGDRVIGGGFIGSPEAPAAVTNAASPAAAGATLATKPAPGGVEHHA